MNTPDPHVPEDQAVLERFLRILKRVESITRNTRITIRLRDVTTNEEMALVKNRNKKSSFRSEGVRNNANLQLGRLNTITLK